MQPDLRHMGPLDLALAELYMLIDEQRWHRNPGSEEETLP